MEIQPQSNIKLLSNVPLDTSYDHTIYFANASAQYQYFFGKRKYTLSNQSYQRVNKGKARVGVCADNIYDCNYMMFQNTAFGSKWFYAYITSIEYVNNETSEISFEIDPIQTWWFDFRIDDCFVEREHPVTDNKYEHLVPENLELGDYEIIMSNAYDMNNMGIAMLTSKVKNGSSFDPPNGGTYNNVYTPLEVEVALGTTTQDGKNLTDPFVTDGQEDSIIAMYQFPLKFGIAGVTYENWNLAPQNYLAGNYVPKNNKLFSYPFNLCVLTNFDGQTAELKWEQWSAGHQGEFEVAGTGMGEPCAIMYPKNYRGKGKDWDSGITYNGFPTIPIVGDAFKAYWAQNRTKTYAGMSASMIKLVGATAAIASGAVTGGVGTLVGVGALAGGVGSVGGALGQLRESEKIPNQVQGRVSSDYLNAGMNKNYFDIQQLTIKEPMARVIDDYFTKFGYAIHRVKTPNTHSRPHWNYVKTISATITGSIPADDAKKICQILDNGVTFWKNGSEIGNYSLDNRPT